LLGSGLILINPPFTLEPQLRGFLPALGELLSPTAAATRTIG